MKMVYRLICILIMSCFLMSCEANSAIVAKKGLVIKPMTSEVAVAKESEEFIINILKEGDLEPSGVYKSRDVENSVKTALGVFSSQINDMIESRYSGEDDYLDVNKMIDKNLEFHYFRDIDAVNSGLIVQVVILRLPNGVILRLDLKWYKGVCFEVISSN